MNYSKLRGRIKEIYGSETAMAQAMQISRVSLSNKLNNKTKMSVNDIQLFQNLLNINSADVGEYFFTH